MMKINYSKKFKSDLKAYKNNKKVLDRLEEILKLIANGEPLPESCRLHTLKNKKSTIYDCHVFPNVILLYTVDEQDSNVVCIRIGGHSKVGLTETLKLKISESVTYPKRCFSMVNNSSRKRLTIAEDTACVPSKTSYAEDGMDKNGIYYFGKKPDIPLNWKEYKKGRKKMKNGDINRAITEAVETAEEKTILLDTIDVEDGTLELFAYMENEDSNSADCFICKQDGEELDRFDSLCDALNYIQTLQENDWEPSAEDWMDDSYDDDYDFDDEFGDDEFGDDWK